MSPGRVTRPAAVGAREGGGLREADELGDLADRATTRELTLGHTQAHRVDELSEAASFAGQAAVEGARRDV